MEPPKGVNTFENANSIFWFTEDGIVCSIYKKVPPIGIEESRKILAEFKKMLNGKKVCFVVDISNAPQTTRQERKEGAAEMEGITKALALISNSPMGRMVANLFFGLRPSSYPVKMFADELEAINWLKQYL